MLENIENCFMAKLNDKFAASILGIVIAMGTIGCTDYSVYAQKPLVHSEFEKVKKSSGLPPAGNESSTVKREVLSLRIKYQGSAAVKAVLDRTPAFVMSHGYGREYIYYSNGWKNMVYCHDSIPNLSIEISIHDSSNIVLTMRAAGLKSGLDKCSIYFAKS